MRNRPEKLPKGSLLYLFLNLLHVKTYFPTIYLYISRAIDMCLLVEFINMIKFQCHILNIFPFYRACMPIFNTHVIMNDACYF